MPDAVLAIYLLKSFNPQKADVIGTIIIPIVRFFSVQDGRLGTNI